MFSVFRPFLFNLDPEIAHDLAIKSLKFNPLPSKMFEVEDEEMLNIELLGKQFPNPIGLAAGFDKSAEVYNSLLKLGFGFVEVGTATPLKQFGNPKPNFNNELYTSALLSKPAARPIGLGNCFPNNSIFNIFSSSTSNILLGKGLNLSDLIAKSCAVSGSKLNKKGLKTENII